MPEESPLPPEDTVIPSREAPEEPNVEEVQEKRLPVCVLCHKNIEKLSYLDYQEIRVVFHEGPGCVVGVMNSK